MEVKKGHHKTNGKRNLNGSVRTASKIKSEEGFISFCIALREAGKITLSKIVLLQLLP